MMIRKHCVHFERMALPQPRSTRSTHSVHCYSHLNVGNGRLCCKPLTKSTYRRNGKGIVGEKDRRIGNAVQNLSRNYTTMRENLAFVCSSISRNQGSENTENSMEYLFEIFRRAAGQILGTMAVLSLVFGQPILSPAIAEDVGMRTPNSQESDKVLTFPVADSPELFRTQRTLVEAWSIVSEAFVDPTFNNHDWPAELSERLNAVASAQNPSEAESQIGNMMAALGDPFTRWMTQQDYQNFRISSDGEVKGGVGLLIAQDPSSGRLMVLAPIKGSPAERAGIQPGDEVVTVNGKPTTGMDGETAARVLRGERGSSVTVEVARRKEAVPGVAGLVDPASSSRGEYYSADSTERKRFRLKRETVELSPIFASTTSYDDHTYGYIRLVTFSQHAAEDMRKAIDQLQRDGAEAFILDLRNNPGGLVTSAMDIASIWLDGSQEPTVFSVQDRTIADQQNELQPANLSFDSKDMNSDGKSNVDGGQTSIKMGIQRVVLSGGHPATKLPLVVLVNRQSASASELLAGALHDNMRAEVVGDRTFGKGKIQSVFELSDGSALFVTVAKYLTPNGTDIDQIGVNPDRSCSTSISNGTSTLTGIPVGPSADQMVMEELATDECVLTAETVLESHSDQKMGRLIM